MAGIQFPGYGVLMHAMLALSGDRVRIWHTRPTAKVFSLTGLNGQRQQSPDPTT